MLSVGSKGQQFIIRNFLVEVNYTGNPDTVKTGDGVLAHFTIDPDVVKEWNLSGSVISLTDPTKFYYIYAKCSKSTNTGIFEVTETQYQTDQTSYYYFLIGVIHSEFENVRGISLTYGQTTINGKFITTGVIRSIDGYNLIDLDTNKIVLGNQDTYIDWNNRVPGKLVVNDVEIDNSLMVKNLWAEEATIADWRVKDGKITSIAEFNSKPRAQFDGNNGKITLVSPKQVYSELGVDNEYEHTLEIDSIEGKIEARHTGDANQESGKTVIDSEGIIADFAGINLTPINTGQLIKTSIAGVGNGKLELNSYTGNNQIVGVFGSAENKSSTPAKTFGGFFLGLMAYGLHIKTGIVLPDLSSYTINEYEVLLSCYNTVNLNLYLPPNPQGGRVILVKRINNPVRVYGNGGNEIMRGSNVTFIDVLDSHIWLFCWDGSYWVAAAITG